MKKLLTILCTGVFVLFTQFSAIAQGGYRNDHPHYIKALSNLRAARWMIEHRPGNWQKTTEEDAAIRKIDDAINEIKRAAIDDGKNINDHPPMEERPDHHERLRAALEYLNMARDEISREEDNPNVRGLRDRAIRHINEAIQHTENARRM